MGGEGRGWKSGFDYFSMVTKFNSLRELFRKSGVSVCWEERGAGVK